MHLVNRFVIPFVIGGLPAFTHFYLSSLPSTHPPTSLQVASSPLRPAFPASRLRRLRTALVYTRSFFPQSSYLSTRSSTRTTNPIKTLDTNIFFTLLLQISSLARFTHGSQRYVVLQGPQFVRLTPYLGTRRHRLPRHRPDFILIPAPDGMCLPPPIAAIH